MKFIYYKGDIIENYLVKLLNKPEYYNYVHIINDKLTAVCDFNLEVIDEFTFTLERT